MRAISIDLRERVLKDFHAGLKPVALAGKYTVTASWVRSFLKRHQATGEVAARRPVSKKPPFHRRHEAVLRAAVAANPDHTLATLRACLGLKASIGTLCTALHKLKLSFKKKRSSPRNSGGRTSSRNAGSSRPSSGSASTRTGSSSSTRHG